ncbi:MAG: N-6 DNA methylase [Chloroflexi bacterium]|nr:N-6 DNA methylase [Chloroflexota bacterium]
MPLSPCQRLIHLKSWGHDFAPNDPHHRFDGFGAIPPRTRGDLAFLLHMLAVTNERGMVGVVMPHGILFRGGSEGTIRKGLVEADRFEGIIGLAPNLNISRYVDTTRHEEVISVEEAPAQLREAERRRDEAMARMHALLAELGYGAPAGETAL